MTLNEIELQPHLQDDLVSIQPLKKDDFETLFTIASDPLIWEQHPNPDRCKREVFEIFFKGAIESGGAFLIKNNKTGKAIGTSRYYVVDNNTVAIGYTFFARDHWGTTYNRAVKTLMLDHAFTFCSNSSVPHWSK